jgi:N-methylhydantoinase B/oxoprolinase/acetone carboxylase alpha subunit
MVQEDVIQGYLSLEKARDDYGVVIDPVTMEIVGEATRSVRQPRERL